MNIEKDLIAIGKIVTALHHPSKADKRVTMMVDHEGRWCVEDVSNKTGWYVTPSEAVAAYRTKLEELSKRVAGDLDRKAQEKTLDAERLRKLVLQELAGTR